MGGSGTGKTHVGIALGLAAIAAGFRVRFTSVMQLVQELLQAEAEYRLPRYLRTWDKFDLVILDELGYVSLAQGGPLLFQFCADRYEKGSLLITTNLEFARWTDVFHDVTLTTALLDRLTHHSHILVFEGESYRFRESQRRSHETA
jgi:DNA replication protein DnaC